MPRLLDAGLAVRAMARNPDKLADAPWRDDVEVVRGDLSEPDSLTAAFDGVDVVYYLVHSMGTSKDFVAEEGRVGTQRRHRRPPRRRAAVGVPERVCIREGTQLSPHLESRKAVGEILLASGIETIVLQAGVVIGSGSASFEMIRHLTDRLPVDDDAEVGAQQDPADRRSATSCTTWSPPRRPSCRRHAPGTSVAPTFWSTAT